MGCVVPLKNIRKGGSYQAIGNNDTPTVCIFLNPCLVEFFLEKWYYPFYFTSFLDNQASQVVVINCQWPHQYPTFTQSLLIKWRRKGPGHHQQWYWTLTSFSYNLPVAIPKSHAGDARMNIPNALTILLNISLYKVVHISRWIFPW